LMKAQYHLILEGVTPINILKSAFKEVFVKQDLKVDLVKLGIEYGANYISRKLANDNGPKSLSKVLFNALLLTVTNAIEKRPEAVEAAATNIVKVIDNGLLQLKNSK